MLSALLLSNMRPSREHPERGAFVRDQAAALAALPEVQLELHEHPPGARALAAATLALRRRYAGRRFDVVHAHFGLTAWPALAVPATIRAVTFHGTDLEHPRTRLASAAILPFIDLPATVSPGLLDALPARTRKRAAVLPCGYDATRFAPIDRLQACARLGLAPERRRLLFPSDPGRPEKRYDRACALRDSFPADERPELVALRGVEPDQVKLWINSSDAVVIPSEREGFGLAAIEALACDVPVLATPVGIHAEALAGIPGTLCAPFDAALWHQALQSIWSEDRRRIAGQDRAGRYSAAALAEAVLAAWQQALRGKRRRRQGH